MKFIVDELPCGCNECVFSDIQTAPRDSYLCKCKLLDKEEYISDKYNTRLDDCPFRGLKEELNITVEKYTKWEDIRLKVTINLGDDMICNDYATIGSSGWSDY